MCEKCEIIMREHTTVPNVFRVACSQNVNTKPQIHKNGDDAKKQQQPAAQSEQQQQPKILVHTSTLTNATTTATTKANNILANGAVGELTSKQQQQTLSSDNNTTIGGISNGPNHTDSTQNTMQPCNIANSAMLHNHSLQPHKLTATASIERANFGSSVTQTGRREQFQQQQQQQMSQQSLYGTLPRSMPAAALQRNSSANNNKSNNRDLNGITASGVINTISGSLPSATALAAADRNGSRSNSSLTSDLNGGFASATHSKSNKLNGIQPQQMNKSREFLVTRPGGRMTHYQQQRMRQCGNNNGVQQRYGNGGYLWILTPVAAR